MTCFFFFSFVMLHLMQHLSVALPNHEILNQVQDDGYFVVSLSFSFVMLHLMQHLLVVFPIHEILCQAQNDGFFLNVMPNLIRHLSIVVSKS